MILSFNKLFKIFDNTFIAKRLPFLLSAVAIVSGLLTYATISYGGVSLAQRTFITMPFILFDVIIAVLLTVVIVNRVVLIFKEQRRGAIGAHLHITIISIFSLVTMTPSIVVAILAVTFFKSGVSVWFSEPVQSALNDARVVAELYLQEHMRGIRVDAVDVASKVKSLIHYYNLFSEPDRKAFQKELDEILVNQNLEEALIFLVNQHDKMTTSISSSLAFSLELAAVEETNVEELNIAASGEIVVKEHRGMVQALTYINSDLQDISMYMWIGKGIDKNIIKYVTKARDSTRYYNDLLKNQHQFQIILITLFALSSILLLLAAIWTGITLANILVLPITRLIAAADSVSKGDLSVRVEEIPVRNELDNLVQSFNRMTEMLEKQNKDLIISEKKSAWSDIARKIAHEVKNPLTPIQLSAERLKRKYLKEITTDPDVFTKCIDTIIRQVSHIESLINEFSTFARMPEPVMEYVNMTQLIRDAIFLQKQAFPNITFHTHWPDTWVIWICDAQQIMQVMTNLLQNAANAITENGKTNGNIWIMMRPFNHKLNIIIEDDGPGFPQEQRERLFEPYYTTREKGTGLGMAIVLRIITEHSGKLELKDAFNHVGARVEITLPNLKIKD